MFKKVTIFFTSLRETVKQTPVEIGVTVLYWILCMADMARWNSMDDWLIAFPICFWIVYGLNRFTDGSRWRWLYYASAVVPLGLAMWQVDFYSTVYYLSLLFSLLFAIYGSRRFENGAFVREGLKYLSDLISALCLGTVFFLMVLAIYYSAAYIFDFGHSSRCMEYSALTAYLLLVPSFFLVFNVKPGRVLQMEGFSALLVNFILTPALLIYTVMLYLYFGKIAILWSLPKGGLSYMVISFVLLVYALRAVQPMLNKRYYNWFYQYFSWWVLPALVMLWVGICYRIGEYGLTEKRLYLLLGAVGLTFVIVVSFRRFHREYAMTTAVVALFFALFTYIPGISAKDLGLASQLRNLKWTIEKLKIADTSGKILADVRLEYNDTLKPLHQRLYESFKLLEREKGSQFMYDHFGVSTSEYVSDTLLTYHLYSEQATSRREDLVYLFIGDWVGKSMDIRKYSKLEDLRSKEGNLSYVLVDGLLTLERQGELIARIDINQWFHERMTEARLDPKIPHASSDFQTYSSHFAVCDGKGVRLIFEQLDINAQDNTIDHVEICYVLLE